MLNLIYYIKSKNELNEVKNLEKIINTLSGLHELHEKKKLNWNNCKEIIPFYVESLKKIIEFAPSNYFSKLFQVLEDISNDIISSINNKTETKNDIICLKSILLLILKEQKEKSSEENRNPAILPLNTIINIYLNMIKLLITEGQLDPKYTKLCKIFNLSTNLMYYNFSLYKGNFEDKIIYNRKLKKTLTLFCKNVRIFNSIIYNKRNDDSEDLKDFNEFLGLTVPKLYILLKETDNKNNIEIDNDSAFIIGVVNKFYKKLFDYIKTRGPENVDIFFGSKKGDEVIDKEKDNEIIEILKNKNIQKDSIKYLEQVYNLMKNSTKIPLLMNNENDKNITEMFSNRPKKDLKFNEVWNKIQLEINYRKGLNNFQETVKSEINKDRRSFVRFLFDFFREIEGNELKNVKNADKNLNPSITFFNNFFNSFENFYSIDFFNYKSELYFFYWVCIYIMEYDKDEGNFNSLNKAIFNKEYFEDLNIIKFTINHFSNMNIYSNNYENLLFIKFFNCYLCELDDKRRADFLMLFIDRQEGKNIFSLLHYTLNELKKKIDLDINEANNKNIDRDYMEGSDNYAQNEVKYNYSPHLFENDLDEYELSLELLSNLSENNDIMKGKMKDFLRTQYNSSKSHNFINIMASIIEVFVSSENHDNIFLIEKYFNIIIKIIECITKCCNGASKENQDCVVKETKMLKFTKYILEKITYRQKIFFDDGINSPPSEVGASTKEEKLHNLSTVKSSITYFERERTKTYEAQEIGLDRKRLTYLKYKLLLFLTVLTVGREKEDKIFELIHHHIDFNTLGNILIETYKEILIEKDCTRNRELLSFDENMLTRMDNIEYKDLSKWNEAIIGDNFIIFENGTYAYILLNLYLDNLSKPMDIGTREKIVIIKDKLKKIKSKPHKSSIFSNVKDYINCVSRCLKSIWDFNKKVKINEDFYMKNSFAYSYKFFFEYTQNIEIKFNNKIISYYVKLSSVSKCLTKEIKEDFQSRLDRSSTKSKIEYLFGNIDFLEYQLTRTKIRLDIIKKHPILDLLFNQYYFYRDIFLIINALLNLLIFASYYNDIDENLENKQKYKFNYRYGILYQKKYIRITENILFYGTMVEMIIGFLILINYIIIHIPALAYYKKEKEKNNESKKNDEEKSNQKNETNAGNKKIGEEKKKEINNIEHEENYTIKRIFNIFLNVCQDQKLIFHLLLFLICFISFSKRNYTYLIILLTDVVERSKVLMCIVKSIWLPKKQILVTLFLFYLIAYYFSILIYLFIPSHVPSFNCRSFSNCFFTLCDQTIKNSNGIINYLTEEGLYIYNSLFSNPRFYIDNWFAIIDTMLILQILAGIIIDNFISQKEDNENIEKDKKNRCFICGLTKDELNKYYTQLGFNEHIKLDHNLWNYVFCIFNIIKKDHRTLIPLDLLIYESYKKKNLFNMDTL